MTSSTVSTRKVAIVGGQGFIGRPLLRRLSLSAGYEAVAWDLPDTDVRDPVSLGKRFDAFLPDIVVNCAAVLGGMDSRGAADIFRTNVLGHVNLLEECNRRGVLRFILASSLTAHGSNDPARPHELDSPFQPMHAYGASKAAAEYALQEYAGRFGMTAIALRPTVVLGEKHLVHAPIEFVSALLEGKDIVVYGTGEHEREWIWIDDAVQGFVRAIQLVDRLPPGYHPFFLSGNRLAMRDLAFACVNRLGGNIRHAEPTVKSFTLTCRSEESNAFLGWKATTDMYQMIQRLVESQMARAGGEIDAVQQS